jgi:hypothetical protein
LSRTLSADVKAAIIAIAIGFIVLLLAAFLIISNLVNISTFLPAPAVSVARNWGGYLVASDLNNPQSTVIGVNGSWIVPSVTDIGADAFSAAWVGIGGQFDDTLIQTGTEHDFLNGSAVYYAWYEMLPQESITIDSMAVAPGDQMQASIDLVDASSSLWAVSIADLTSGQSFQQNFAYNSSQLSAEWIIERPDINNVISTLADFGSITFSNCYTTFVDKNGSISDFPNTPIVMSTQTSRGQTVQLTDASGLSNNGTQFTVTYIA